MADAGPDYLRQIPNETSEPPELLDSVRRQRKRFASLVDSLWAAGFDETFLEVSVRKRVERYCVEVTAAKQALVRGKPDA